MQDRNLEDFTGKPTLRSMRRNQESSLKSVKEKSFSTSSSSSSSSEEQTTIYTITKTMHQQTSSHTETTGGNVTNDDEKASFVSPMMEVSACPTGKSFFVQQQQSSVASSSSSVNASPSETTRKTKTLSFLHNEDLFASGTSLLSMGNSRESLNNAEKLLPTSSHLFRSISFQERQCQKTNLMRTESERESGDTRGVRKMAILSPMHSLQELQDRMKQQQMRMFSISNSSECSL